MQQHIKRREGPLPPHTCWASTPNLSQSISSPPPVQSNYITLVSNQSVSLHHSAHIPPHLLYPALYFCVPPPLPPLPPPPPPPVSVESADFKKRKWVWAKCLGTFSCSRRAVQHIHLSKCSAVKCSMFVEPYSIILLSQLILRGRYQRCLW